MSELITMVEEPKIDRWRETRIEYTERLGDASKSFSIETHMMFDELTEFVDKLMNAQTEQEEGKNNDN